MKYITFFRDYDARGTRQNATNGRVGFDSDTPGSPEVFRVGCAFQVSDRGALVMGVRKTPETSAVICPWGPGRQGLLPEVAIAQGWESIPRMDRKTGP